MDPLNPETPTAPALPDTAPPAPDAAVDKAAPLTEQIQAEQAATSRKRAQAREAIAEADLAGADAEISDAEFDALLERYDQMNEVDSGDLVMATIVSISHDSVMVDLGDKTEGVVPIDEFKDSAGNLTSQIGDRVDILVIHRDAETGQVLASRRRAVVQAALAQLEAALAGDDPLTGKVTKAVKNGLLVDLGIECFMPASHVDIRRVGDLQPWIGQEVEVMVLELHRGRKRAVVSRRAWLERQQSAAREKFFAAAKPGDVITGKVKNLTDFGAFLDLGGFDGLVPRDELSWERGMSPSDLCSLGDDMAVQIVTMNAETGKITLSRKRTMPDPWATVDERIRVGDVVEGTVVNVTPYGAFVRIEEGLTGLVHASDLSWGSGRKRPQDFVNVNDRVKAQVLEANAEKRRLSLGLKQITVDPFSEVEQEFKQGRKVKGTVTSVTNFGLFVQLKPGIEGLVHQSDLSWDRRMVDPKTIAKSGDEIEVVVLKVDRANRKISLGHKQLSESPYLAFAKAHPANSTVKGKVTRIVSFGAFVELAPSVEGLVHISHLGPERVEKVEDVVKPGDEIEVKVLKVEPRQEKITLSRRAFLRDLERQEIAQYASKSTHGGSNLGELFRAAGLKVGKDAGGSE